MVVDSLLQYREMLLELALCIGRSDVKRSYKEFKSSTIICSNSQRVLSHCFVCLLSNSSSMSQCAQPSNCAKVHLSRSHSHANRPRVSPSADQGLGELRAGFSLHWEESRSDLDLEERGKLTDVKDFAVADNNSLVPFLPLG